MLAADKPPDKTKDKQGTVDPGLPGELRAAANRDVTERTLAGYVMAEYDADLGAMPVRGNFGVRVVRTDVTSNGLRSDLILVPDDTAPGRFPLRSEERRVGQECVSTCRSR